MVMVKPGGMLVYMTLAIMICDDDIMMKTRRRSGTRVGTEGGEEGDDGEGKHCEGLEEGGDGDDGDDCGDSDKHDIENAATGGSVATSNAWTNVKVWPAPLKAQLRPPRRQQDLVQEKVEAPTAARASYSVFRRRSLTMFGSLDGFSMDFRDHDVMKIFVRRNGTSDALREVFLPPNSKISDLLEKCTKAGVSLRCRKAFHSNGVECTDVDQVDQGEVIHVSCGEAFKVTDGGAGTQVVGDYVLHEKLGQGGFGSVLKGVHVETGEAAAVKFVPKKSFRQFSDLQRVFQEIQALRNLRHPHIIRVLDVADHPDSICFIMEYAAGGELRGYVEEHSFLEEDEARTFFKQIVRAVHYIHSKKIIHRDLKLENVLLDAHNRP
ncbi:SNF1 [Symbiodinium microadriaticum]|nr:SNF1 [Symbiodinium microadriaticum]